MGQAASCNNFTHPVKRAQYQIVAKVDCRGGRGRGKTDCVVGIGLIAAKGDAALPRLCCGQSSVMLRQAMYFLDNAHTDNRLAVLSCHVRWGGRREARGERGIRSHLGLMAHREAIGERASGQTRRKMGEEGGEKGEQRTIKIGKVSSGRAGMEYLIARVPGLPSHDNLINFMTTIRIFQI